MIPKVIHYCWFGRNPLPESAQNYIKTWEKYCPGYKIIEWNEDNFDVNQIVYTHEAYDFKKWAFITDYVRLYVLYHHGGIYMDTDVEVIKPLTPFLNNRGFSGFELPDKVPTGIMACEAGHPLIKQLLDSYQNKRFLLPDGSLDITTNVELITDTCLNHGLILNNKLQTISDFTFYPTEFFCPKNNRTLELSVTKNTYTIHHFSGSWLPESNKYHEKIKKILGCKNTEKLLKITDFLGITGK